MASAVVAKQAIHRVDAQKHACQVDRMAIICVLRRTSVYVVAYRPIDFALRKAVARRSDQLTRHLVVRFVAGKRIPDVQVERVAARNVAVNALRLGVQLQKIAKKYRPLIDEFGRADEPIH